MLAVYCSLILVIQLCYLSYSSVSNKYVVILPDLIKSIANSEKFHLTINQCSSNIRNTYNYRDITSHPIKDKLFETLDILSTFYRNIISPTWLFGTLFSKTWYFTHFVILLLLNQVLYNLHTYMHRKFTLILPRCYQMKFCKLSN